MDDTEKAIRAGLTEAEIDEAIREPMTIHLLSAADIVTTIVTLRAELAARTEEMAGFKAAARRAIDDTKRLADKHAKPYPMSIETLADLAGAP